MSLRVPGARWARLQHFARVRPRCPGPGAGELVMSGVQGRVRRVALAGCPPGLTRDLSASVDGACARAVRAGWPQARWDRSECRFGSGGGSDWLGRPPSRHLAGVGLQLGAGFVELSSECQGAQSEGIGKARCPRHARFTLGNVL
jgi:hypothetical protein